MVAAPVTDPAHPNASATVRLSHHFIAAFFFFINHHVSSLFFSFFAVAVREKALR